mmetsp:Transcript_7576/g.33437  ORF Transcript_7576/g.33437 Transcript_7576/m.33437 type:complete len:219 (+) Transcript_7576:3657-4313(+)
MRCSSRPGDDDDDEWRWWWLWWCLLGGDDDPRIAVPRFDESFLVNPAAICVSPPPPLGRDPPGDDSIDARPDLSSDLSPSTRTYSAEESIEFSDRSLPLRPLLPCRENGTGWISTEEPSPPGLNPPKEAARATDGEDDSGGFWCEPEPPSRGRPPGEVPPRKPGRRLSGDVLSQLVPAAAAAAATSLTPIAAAAATLPTPRAAFSTLEGIDAWWCGGW